MKNYEIIEHTADIGIKVSASDLNEVFVQAAAAMFEILVDSKSGLIPSITVPIEIKTVKVDKSGVSPTEHLLVKWLQELLFIFETRHLVLSHFYIDELTDDNLEGAAKGLKFDKSRHKQNCQIKAVTYHQLSLGKKNDGWHARIIFDI